MWLLAASDLLLVRRLALPAALHQRTTLEEGE